MIARWKWALLWTAVILGLCWWPKDMLPQPEEGSRTIVLFRLDKYVHAGIFLVFAALAGLASRRTGWARHGETLLVSLGLAVLSELGQTMPWVNRDAGIDDLIADMTGALIGSWIAARLLRTRWFKAPSTGTP